MERMHTFARALHTRFGAQTGLSHRHFLAWGYLAHMSKDIQQAYGEGKLTNADIIKMAERD